MKRPWESKRLPAITCEAPDLPEDVVALVDADLLDLGGTYGRPEAGEPIQYDELRIEHDQGDAEIVVYNRALLLFRTDSEAVRRIHQVCCQLEVLAGRCHLIYFHAVLGCLHVFEVRLSSTCSLSEGRD